MTTPLPFHVDRTLVIRAPRSVVFRFFTDSERWARWWGQGSSIEPRVGGRVVIRYPGNVGVSGAVTELVEPSRIAFTYGYDSNTPIALGGSLVTLTLDEVAEGTRLTLRHEVDTEAVRDQHVDGWRYQLSLFSKIVTEEAQAGVGDIVALWFAAWSAESAAAELAMCTTDDVIFRDAFGVTHGRDDLLGHIMAARKHMSGVRLTAKGAVRHAQGTALASWSMVKADGTELAHGTNVFDLAPDGRIARAVGISEK